MDVGKVPWLRDIDGKLARLEVPGAIIFHGKNGIGKNLIVEKLSQNLLCIHRSENGVACGTCKDCHLFSINSHPDFFTISEHKEENSKIAINDIRKISSFFEKTSHRGRAKIVVIYNAETLGTVPGNAILKLLEAYQTNTFFFLLTEKIMQILPTIRSRCRKIHIRQPSKKTALNWMQENTSDSQEKLNLSLSMAGFAPFKALGLLTDKQFWSSRSQLLEGLCKIEKFETLVNVAEKIKPVTLARTLDMLIYDILLFQVSGNITYHLDRLDQTKKMAANIPKEDLLKWRDKVIDYAKEAHHPVNNKLAIEVLLSCFPYMEARA